MYAGSEVDGLLVRRWNGRTIYIIFPRDVSHLKRWLKLPFMEDQPEDFLVRSPRGENDWYTVNKTWFEQQFRAWVNGNPTEAFKALRGLPSIKEDVIWLKFEYIRQTMPY